MAATPLMICYNKTLFDAAGLAYPRPDWTMEDFLSTAQALTRQTEKGMQYGYISQVGEGEELAIFAAAQGVALWDEDGRPRFDTPEALAAVQWYTDLALRHQVTPIFAPAEPGDIVPGDFLEREELIRSGQAAMWSQFYPYDTVPKRDHPTAAEDLAAPAGRGAAGTNMIYDGFSIAAGSEYVQACWQWIPSDRQRGGDLAQHPARLMYKFAAIPGADTARRPIPGAICTGQLHPRHIIHHIDRWDIDIRPLPKELPRYL
jgi:multiple sugar transport system substrate-binding protein